MVYFSTSSEIQKHYKPLTASQDRSIVMLAWFTSNHQHVRGGGMQMLENLRFFMTKNGVAGSGVKLYAFY